MTTMTLQAPDGGSFTGYAAAPDTIPAPGIIVIQEIFGVNQVMRDICDGLARQGYLALCPDIFWRIEPNIELTDQTEKEWERAFELFTAFNVEHGVGDLKAAAEQLRQHEACSGKVGSIGYCLGGKLAFLMASRSGTDCNVSYYGVGLDELMNEVPEVTNPLLMHVASEDKFVPAEAQAAIKAGVAGNANITLHVYDGQDHAFAREGGNHYDKAAAELANQRSAEFFAAHLR